MAAPIAHIFLAVHMLAGPLHNLFDEKEFIRGTSFPDIRYLKCVERAQTHFENVTLDDVKKEKNSFKAGMLFHSFVDEQREKYIVEHKIYDKLPQFRFTTQALKFAEDKLLMSLFNIQKYKSYFDGLIDAERAYNISDEHIKMWHTFLQKYFNGSLSTHDLMMNYFDINEPDAWSIKRWFFSWYYARKINAVIENIVKDNEIKEPLLRFYLNFVEYAE